MNKLRLSLIASCALLACTGSSDESNNKNNNSEEKVESMRFETLSSNDTGIEFFNTIEETEEFNFYNYEYIYNGAGVAVGDVNNDGLPDLYFSGNQVQDKLYLNQGDMKFKDITETAFDENANEGWHTGVTMVDVNGDGWLDIYVCRSGNPKDRSLMGNLLFINNGDNTFTEKGKEYGVDVAKRTTQAAFFDYDNDGDLDLYVMNHPIKEPRERFVTVNEFLRLKKYGEDADVFLENRDGKFVDISKEAGIENNCFGLGIAIGDVDGNGFADVYISNDYQDPDFLYMNNGDGTFSEEIKERTNHISNYSMGNDIADFNNDGALDIMTLDMAAEDHVRSKRNMGGMSTKNFWDLVSVGFHYQYMFNGLQMNNGDGTFTDVGQLAGVSKTDWSWAPLFADFDNDGKKDLFITNGYRREARDNDYTRTYSIKEERGEIENFEEGLALMPTTKIYNYIFKNEGEIHFSKKTEEWNINAPINSSGAAYADLDNDGDLDLIINNMEEMSFIMENKLETSNNYVKIKVTGEGKNSEAIGAKVKVFTGDEIQFQELHYTRGYESSVERELHFGIGDHDQVDKVQIQWTNGATLEKTNIAANKRHEFGLEDANNADISPEKVQPLMTNVSDSLFDFVHHELMADDFKSEVLLPNKMSQLGPFISKGDVNGDGREDLYVSGAADFSGKLYVQQANGTFKEKAGPWNKQSKREEMDSEFFDADGDGDLDLYVVSGGNEYNYQSELMKDQLYINDGKGNFTNESKDRLPKMESSGQRILIGDYDNDGDLDLYVPGRQTPGYYPFAPRSYLLSNAGNGIFSDATASAMDPNHTEDKLNFMGPGMVTDGLFDDFDQDGDLDIVLVGEWMPVTFFENNQGKFIDVTDRMNPSKEIGWWYSISSGDFNGDGINDYVAGNLGGNNKFHPSKEKPLELYCSDFDENGTYDIVLAKYQDNICYPVRGKQCSSEQMPFINKKFPTFSEFASANLESIYGEEKLNQALHYSATSFKSSVLLSENGVFSTHKLPVFAQLGPINESIVMDVNNDGFLDIIAAGNNFAAEVETIRYDGGRGVVMLGDGKGNFEDLTLSESGFYEPMDCKDMVLVNSNGRELVITVSNRAPSKTFIFNN
ncbi:VCBS repeat-containing protein [Crocinitomix algicola]|uniref:VCBS repeat-containing protein n=1 Tax=Crocinitomix algicola TaxID=1740263 RepID=UPI000835C81F|nr:VCBS repeat-containing protein [Crocinitomix algicola]